MDLYAGQTPHISYYDATNGDLKYARYVESSQLASGGVVVDSNNNFVITGVFNLNNKGPGYTPEVILVRKYDQSNNLLWERMYNNQITSTVGGSSGDVAIDSNNNIFVAQRIKNPARLNFTDHLLLKYDANGTFLWDNKHDALGGWDEACGVAVDSNGYAVTAGCTSIFITSYGFTIKWDQDGNIVWANQWHENDSSSWGVAIDNSGNYATMQYRWSPVREIIIAGYNPNGELVYLQRYSSGIDDWPGGITVDGDGNIIIVGYSGMYDLGDSRTIVVKYALS